MTRSTLELALHVYAMPTALTSINLVESQALEAVTLQLQIRNCSKQATNEVARLSGEQNLVPSVSKARNIPLDQSDHFSLDAVTGLYRGYRYTLVHENTYLSRRLRVMSKIHETS
ncbi:hypothetical protein TNCV_1593681 [Trichonephila clavipes]|nr:hypothetical protein TNCV_1593681 [Trichonephila clavipes]